jgi:hypothetical protein
MVDETDDIDELAKSADTDVDGDDSEPDSSLTDDDEIDEVEGEEMEEA